jgi:Mn-dependent DtxR family transcriptional regulator
MTMHTATLPRMVLRAVYALTESGAPTTLRTLVAVVPADASRVIETVKALDQAGYLDAKRMRLTMAGLAAASAPRMVATERRRVARDAHWAGAAALAADKKPGLRKTAIVA